MGSRRPYQCWSEVFPPSSQIHPALARGHAEDEPSHVPRILRVQKQRHLGPVAQRLLNGFHQRVTNPSSHARRHYSVLTSPVSVELCREPQRHRHRSHYQRPKPLALLVRLEPPPARVGQCGQRWMIRLCLSAVPVQHPFHKQRCQFSEFGRCVSSREVQPHPRVSVGLFVRSQQAVYQGASTILPPRVDVVQHGLVAKLVGIEPLRRNAAEVVRRMRQMDPLW